jgi:hypothetical protein
LESVASIKFIDTSGSVRTLPSASFVVDASSDEIGREYFAPDREQAVVSHKIRMRHICRERLGGMLRYYYRKTA